jgi:hypothetical protein
VVSFFLTSLPKRQQLKFIYLEIKRKLNSGEAFTIQLNFYPSLTHTFKVKIQKTIA